MRAKEFIVEVEQWSGWQKFKNWAAQRMHPTDQGKTAAYTTGMRQRADERMQNELIQSLSSTLPRLATSGAAGDVESYIRDFMNKYISAYTVPVSLKPQFEKIVKQLATTVETTKKFDQNAVAYTKALTDWIIDVEQAQVRDPRTQRVAGQQNTGQQTTVGGPRGNTYGYPKVDVQKFDVRGTDYKYSLADRKWYNIDDPSTTVEIQDPADINALNKLYYESLKAASPPPPSSSPSPLPPIVPPSP